MEPAADQGADSGPPRLQLHPRDASRRPPVRSDAATDRARVDDGSSGHGGVPVAGEEKAEKGGTRET